MPGCYGREDTGGMGNASTDNIRTVELLKELKNLRISIMISAPVARMSAQKTEL